MADLKALFKYYLDHQEELVKDYNGKYLVITDFKVAGAYNKAWRNEKLAMMTAKIENRPTERPKATEYRPQLLTVPANYYGVRGMYYGD